MAIDAQSQRSTKILINLAAGLDELGKPFQDGSVKLTSNLRLAASAGAAALNQLQGVPLSGAMASSPSAREVPEQKTVPPAKGEDLPTPVQWLDRLKEARGFHADITLAEYLGVSKHLFSQWRTGKTSLTVDEAWRVAVELGANPLLVIASIGFHSGDAMKRQAWLDLAGTLLPPQGLPVELPAGSVAVSTATAKDTDRVPPAAESKSGSERLPGLESKGAKWSPEEDERLVREYKESVPVPDIANRHGRSIGAILTRLYKIHDLMSDDVMQAECERYGVRFNPKVPQSQNPSEASQVGRAAGDTFL
ncbi:helix-turn-helix domain-containing protein [Ralstonia pseudosolanacearum]|uniref:helix-turn-helix domain-containing protein n=1 Tax=Ralstonia pseudosolanacearum TaxID=1310165 RepID=UPI003CF962F1